jgi:hypothetical protein
VIWADSITLLANGKITQSAPASSLTTETVRAWMTEIGA